MNQDSLIPMGSTVNKTDNPTFRVKAVGAFEQKPGCPDYSSTDITKKEIERICKNECYNPSDERKVISRIEVIKVSPQVSPNEKVEDLIQDPWKIFECPIDQNGCEISFEDESFSILSSYDPLLILLEALITLDKGTTIRSANFKPIKVDNKINDNEITI